MKWFLQVPSLVVLAALVGGCQSPGRATAHSTLPQAVASGAPFAKRLEQAEQGQAQAQYDVGECYARGQRVPRDPVQAVRWFRKAAAQGCASAQAELGRCYLQGEGVECDTDEAVKWARQAADQGNAEAQLLLGQAFFEGRTVGGSYEQAEEWLNKAADQGNAQARGFLLGLAYLTSPAEGKEAAAALKELRALADQGNAAAQTYLGVACIAGNGATNGWVEAVKWFQKAADQDIALSQALLGVACLRGQGVPRNARRAVEWLQRSADQGDPMAEQTLGYCYQTGQGVHRDPARAVKWFRKAAAQGSEESQAVVGFAYLRGRGVPRDEVQAYKWLDLAAAQGNAEAVVEREKLACRLTPEQMVQAGRAPRRYLTKFDRKIIEAHAQRYDMSCIPSSVEMVLKLLARVPASYYEQQDAWKHKADGSFHNFDGKTIAGVTFHQQFTQAHGESFPLAQLFDAIDRELKAGRFVIVGLACPGGTHNWVIYDEDTSGDFLAVSKAWKKTIEDNHVRKTITRMRGTDIGTYEGAP